MEKKGASCYQVRNFSHLLIMSNIPQLLAMEKEITNELQKRGVVTNT